MCAHLKLQGLWVGVEFSFSVNLNIDAAIIQDFGMILNFTFHIFGEF